MFVLSYIRFCVLISIRESSCDAVAVFASVDPDTVKETLLPSLLSLLSDSEGLVMFILYMYIYPAPCIETTNLTFAIVDPSVQLHVVDMLAAVCVVQPILLELGVPSLIEQFGHLLKAPTPPHIHLASSVSSALVHVTRTCIGWEICQTLLSGGLLQRLVAVCVMSRDVISPMLENIAIILSLFTQTADER